MSGEQQLFKRGRIWWARIPSPNGGRKLRVSTGCTDKKAAELKARDLERRAVDPTYRAANETRLAAAADRFLSECDDREISEETRAFYAEKCRHITRAFGLLEMFKHEAPLRLDDNTLRPNPRLVLIDAKAVGEYVEFRKSEGAHPHSIQKELITLRGILSLARHRDEYTRNPSEVMPRRFSAKYVPRTTFLEEVDASALLNELPPHRAAHVAFIIATGSRLSEAARAEREDVEFHRGQVRVRGTKTKRARRHVPITSLSAPYLYRAVADAPLNGRMFKPWDKGAMHRDLKAACLRAGIARWVDTATGQFVPSDVPRAKIRKLYPGARVVGSVSPNDLRRTFATWLIQRGVDTYLVSKVLGHVDTKMLERVYGQLDAPGAGRLIEARLAAPIPVLQLCAPAVSAGNDMAGAESSAQRDSAEEPQEEGQPQ